MYIPSHQTLGNHPKLRRLARTLAISRPAAVGHLHYLWWWSQDYAPDGDLSYERYTAEDIADAAMWEGDAYAFVDALKSSGFVDDRDGLLFLHDWEHYGGKVVTDAAKDRERKRAKRNPATSDDAPESSAHVPDTSTGSPPEVHRKSGVDKIRLEETRQEETREPPVSLRSTSPRGSQPRRIPAAWPLPADRDAMDEYAEGLGIRADDTAAHISEYHDYWSSAVKNGTSHDWVKRWRSKFSQDVREGRVGGRASPPGRAAVVETFAEMRERKGNEALAQVIAAKREFERGRDQVPAGDEDPQRRIPARLQPDPGRGGGLDALPRTGGR